MLSSSKSLTQSRVPRLPPPHAKAMTSVQPRGPRHVNNTVPNSQTQTVRSLVKEYRSSSRSLHMSINLASLGGCSTKMSSQQFLQVRKNEECNASPKIEKDNSIALKAQTRVLVSFSICFMSSCSHLKHLHEHPALEVPFLKCHDLECSFLKTLQASLRKSVCSAIPASQDRRYFAFDCLTISVLLLSYRPSSVGTYTFWASSKTLLNKLI